MVSIIIPTYNRSQQLKKTLESLASLKNEPNTFEIIIVDNGSKDDTKLICENFINKINLNIIYVYDDEPGLLTGRHRGAFESKGEILTFIDDDIRVSENWLSTIIENMSKPEFDIMTGPSYPLYEIIPPQWINQFWFRDDSKNYLFALSLLDFGNDPHEIHPNFVWGLNFTIKKSIFYELRGFNPDCLPSKYERYLGDGETGLTRKAYKENKRALYHPGALVYHEVPKERLTIEYFEYRYYTQGISNSYTHIRENSNNQLNNKSNKKSYYQLLKILIYNSLQFIFKNKYKKDESNLVIHMNKKAELGFRFHQNLYCKNKDVRQWVHKNDYFDYKLPRND